MKNVCHFAFFAVLLGLSHGSLKGGFLEDIDYPQLKAEEGIGLPDGSEIRHLHVEYARDGVWAAEAKGDLQGKVIGYMPANPTGFSYHANETLATLSGLTRSILPGLTDIRAQEAWNYFDYSLHVFAGVKVGPSGAYSIPPSAPDAADWDLESHSYTSSSSFNSNNGTRRLDYRIDRDGVTVAVALGNGTGPIDPLFGNSYNAIVVGSSTGDHSRGGTNIDGSGRMKPDVVGTATWTSYATPIVASSAGLLIAHAKSDASLALARRPEVTKALIMAGATKAEFPSWTRTSTAPLDPVFGAGEVNILNSYRILKAGRQPASASAWISARGWDLNTVSPAAPARYFFKVPAGQAGAFSSVITWHRIVTLTNGSWSSVPSYTLNNLNLRLYAADEAFSALALIQESVSPLDNVEHVYRTSLGEGSYVLEVTGSASQLYGIAWSFAGSGAPAPVAPSIVSQPVSQVVTEGAFVSFSVSASGTAPLTYQWMKNGAAIPGATSTSHFIGAATLADAGNYSVRVTNSAGSVTSNAAALTVNALVIAPAITSQPVSRTVNEGDAVLFSVSASGTAPFTYQWMKNGASISGAASASHSIAAAALADAGSYSVRVTNSAGSVTSNTAALAVNPLVIAPAITSQPVSRTVTEGSTVSFSVSASGTAPFTYQWMKNGASISGATSATHSIAAAALADAGSYSVRVTNSAGSVTSNAATLTINPLVVAPAITSQPVSRTVTEGGAASFSVSASGTATLTYQWMKNGASISGATSATHSIAAAALADAGSYSVRVTNSAGSVTSNAAALTVNPPDIAPTAAPTITSQPVAVEAALKTSASFSVTVSGTAPFSYVWRRNGAIILGATTSTLTIQKVAGSSAGSYTVRVSNAAGSVTSDPAQLTIKK